jgi:surface polysaccharide O-acyltransferase-like enzyme
MNKRVSSIEYIRGLAMLGVVGIHTGAVQVSNPAANPHLFALLEIISRFSVPIFFFVSAFSLFRQYPLADPFDAGRFYKRRLARVLFPFVIGSILYMLHYSYLSDDWSIWYPILVYEFFFFGMASYQLYFLVILLWFYLFMPLWRGWVRIILKRPALWLCLLFCAQLLFNYYSSYILRPTFTQFYFNLGIQFRMSWWTLHYLFIFLFGAVFAVRYDQTLSLLRQYRQQVFSFFWLSMAAMLAHYYFLLLQRHYTLEMAVNTVHQLSPAGVFYTLAACLYLMLRLEEPFSPILQNFLTVIGRHSYGIFWIHPLFMYYLHQILSEHALVMDVPATVLFYVATLLCSLFATIAAGAALKKLRSA